MAYLRHAHASGASVPRARAGSRGLAHDCRWASDPQAADRSARQVPGKRAEMVVSLRERRGARKGARVAPSRRFTHGRMRNLRRATRPPVMILQEPTAAPSKILTVEGWLSLEEN